MLRKSVTIHASQDAVWDAWTSTTGVGRFLTDHARVELRLGGPFEIYFDMNTPDETGRRGSEGCKVLSYIPREMLAFEWSFPPAVMPLRKAFARTQVVIRFRRIAEDKTEVDFVQLGWQKGEDWDDGYAYFDRAWSKVLDNLKRNLEQGDGARSVDAGSPCNQQTWTDGPVRVTAIEGPQKRQVFELEIEAPLNVVWDALATSEGLKRLGGKESVVELMPGGAYSFWPGAPNRVLAYVPHEMLSTSGSAPPEFPNVRKGGTWSAYFFEPLGDSRTCLRLVCVGWRPGEKEWDEAFDYFLKNNPVFLGAVHRALSSKESQAQTGPLEHHEIVEAPVEEVWRAFTTKEGIESWMVPHAAINLRVGGLMQTHYDPKGVLGDENTIENTIISFDPMRMLSIKATRPPANFPFKAAIKDMWSVIYLEALDDGRTRVTCRGFGYGEDAESQKLRSHFDKGNAWTLAKLKERFEKHASHQGENKNRVFRDAANQADAGSHLGLLTRLVGTWEGKSKETDGGLFHARIVYELGLNGKVLKGRSYVVKEEGESLVYETFCAWHPGKKQVAFLSASAWDSIYDGIVESAGDTLNMSWTGYAKDKAVDYRQTLRFTDDNSYLWTVHTRTDSGWEKIKEMMVHRVAGGRAAFSSPSEEARAER